MIELNRDKITNFNQDNNEDNLEITAKVFNKMFISNLLEEFTKELCEPQKDESSPMLNSYLQEFFLDQLSETLASKNFFKEQLIKNYNLKEGVSNESQHCRSV
jgi:hypothetical protein